MVLCSPQARPLGLVHELLNLDPQGSLHLGSLSKFPQLNSSLNPRPLLAMSSMAVARYLASPMLVSVWLFSCRRVRPAADTMMRCVFGIRKAAFAAFFFERHRFRCWKNCTEPVDCLMGPGPPGPGVSEVGHAGLGTRLEATGAFGSLRSCCPGREDSERRGEVERSLHLSEVSGLL